MAWTNPATAAVGTLESAAFWNTNVRDNTLWLSSPDRCRVVANATAQSVANSTHVPVTWNTETFDVGGLHSTTTNPTRITIAHTGLYAVSAVCWFDGNAAGLRYMGFNKNGASLGFYVCQNPAGTSLTSVSAYDEIQCSSGDYLETWVEQNTGAALNVNTNAPTSNMAYMSVRWVATS